MQWVQEKFAPAPKKASERAIKHQDPTPAQDEVFQDVSASDTRSISEKKEQTQVVKRPKQPAREVRLALKRKWQLLRSTLFAS